MNQFLGKRFIFGVVAIVCITVATVYLKYDGEVFIKLVGTVVGLFLASQTVTDSQKIQKKQGV